MPTLTIKSIPEPLYRQLKERAAAHRRSLNSEAIVRLERALAAGPDDESALLEELRLLRDASAAYLTDDALRSAIDEDRPRSSSIR